MNLLHIILFLVGLVSPLLILFVFKEAVDKLLLWVRTWLEVLIDGMPKIATLGLVHPNLPAAGGVATLLGLPVVPMIWACLWLGVEDEYMIVLFWGDLAGILIAMFVLTAALRRNGG